jgi:hypothetical protein
MFDELKEKHKLTAKDIKILGEYTTNGFVQWRAYAKYNSVSDTVARTKSSVYFAKGHIKSAISEYCDILIGQYKDTLHYEILDTYRKRAMYDIDMFINADGSIKDDVPKEWKCVIDDIDNNKPTLADRDKALSQLSKYMGMMVEKIEHSGDLNIVYLDKQDANL